MKLMRQDETDNRRWNCLGKKKIWVKMKVMGQDETDDAS